MGQEYTIYCDESEESGRYFSNFYGGALVQSQHIDAVKAKLKAKKAELNLHGEVKWNKITENYAQKYIDLLDVFFDIIEVGEIKVRVMFTQNMNVPKNLSRRHIDEKYFILYYQFIKHAFGLQFSPQVRGGASIRVYPDKMPDTAEKVAQFRSFLVGLSHSNDFRKLGLSISPEDVAEVTSHDHDILQCLDVVMGAMQFRLNDKHLEKTSPSGKRRGKRTKAKERVYKHINKRIRAIYPGFNIGSSTGRPRETDGWEHPYRHWLFVPKERIVVPLSKKRK